MWHTCRRSVAGPVRHQALSSPWPPAGRRQRRSPTGRLVSLVLAEATYRRSELPTCRGWVVHHVYSLRYNSRQSCSLNYIRYCMLGPTRFSDKKFHLKYSTRSTKTNFLASCLSILLKFFYKWLLRPLWSNWKNLSLCTLYCHSVNNLHSSQLLLYVNPPTLLTLACRLHTSVLYQRRSQLFQSGRLGRWVWAVAVAHIAKNGVWALIAHQNFLNLTLKSVNFRRSVKHFYVFLFLHKTGFNVLLFC